MAEFGLPERSAITDANAGVVNPPAKRRIARANIAQGTKQLSASDIGIAQIGRSIGDALGAVLEKEGGRMQQQKILDAEIRQGTETAINSVDKVKQTTGWERAIFGENIEYRAAQQRAVENQVQASYLEQLHNVSTHAGSTPEQYHEQLQKANNKALEQYKDDPETQKLVLRQLQDVNKKLANAHYKQHYAYNQQQQQETTRVQLMQRLDTYNLERANNISPEEMDAHLQEVSNFFTEKYKPEGMDSIAFRALQMEAITTHMKAGNAGAMKAAQATGFVNTFTAPELNQWDNAVSEYDTHFNRQVDLIRTKADIALERAQTPEQIQSVVANKRKELSEKFKLASGSDRSLLIMAKGELHMEQGLTKAEVLAKALQKEEAKTQAAADKKLAELEEQVVKDNALAAYFSTNEPAVKADLQRTHNLTKKEREEGFDTHLLAGAQTFIGGDLPPTVTEYAQELQKNPELQEWTLQEMKRTGEVSPMLKTILSTATQATDRMFDENGNVSEVGLQTARMVDKLLESPKAVDLIGGKDALRQWKIVSLGVQAGSGQQHIEKKVTAYNQNKGKADTAGFQWKTLIGDMSRRDWMMQRLQKLGIPNPSNQMITDELEAYREDVTAFGYDTKEADHSMRMRVSNGKTKIFSSTISNAAYLNEVTKWTAEDFITIAEKHNFLAGKYADLSGSNKEVYRSHTQIPNLRWYTKEGVAGLFASSPSSNNELFISTDEMQEIERYVTEREEVEKATRQFREKRNRSVDISKVLTRF